MLIPEIDLPAHATAITQYDPSLALTCDVMSRSRWPGGELGGWTINYADPAARQWMRNLLHEFVPLFSGPQFHIGCDEVPDGDLPAACPELVAYAREQGYPYPGDVLVEWINEANELVKSYGKRSQLWAWWERCPHSLEPDRDIIVNSWVEKQEPDQFLEAGYQVVCTREDTHYITPTLGLQPDDNYLYDLWNPNPHPNVLGYKICVWADNMETRPDSFFTPLLRHPLAILAERIWAGGTPARSLPTFQELLETGLKEALEW
jgi:hexosaminidase